MLQKTPININFSQGLDLKTDPNQVSLGKFLALNNSVFDKAGRLTKRNGYGLLTTLPNAGQTNITTYNNSLIATGQSLYAYDSENDQWLNRGLTQPVSLNTTSLLKNSAAQTNTDMAIAPNGLVAFVYTEGGAQFYRVSDGINGSKIVGATALPNSATNARVYVLGAYFMITFSGVVSAVNEIQYIAIAWTSPQTPLAVATVAAAVSPAAHDEYVYSDGNGNTVMYFAWKSGSAVRVAQMTSTLVLGPPVFVGVPFAQTDLISLTVDYTQSPATLWVSYFDSFAQGIGAAALKTTDLSVIRAAGAINNSLGTNSNCLRICSTAQNKQLTVFQEIPNAYTFSPFAETNFVQYSTTTESSAPGNNHTVILRSVGLASKAILINGTSYFVTAYGEENQPTYFLTDNNGNVIMKLAYSNGGGYNASMVMSSLTSYNGAYYFSYLLKDFLVSTNKAQQTTNGHTPSSAIFTLTGVNMAQFSINAPAQYSSNIANNLFLTGGIVWDYDGSVATEQGFNVWPENIVGTTSMTGGSIAASTYYYVFTYEWTDNQGNINRSAPSIPIGVVTSGSTSTNTIKVPTLRISYKTNVRIVGYRWSTAQQEYFQFTSLTSPTLNDPTIDFVTFTDTLADASILGNPLVYTTGGVIENIGAPAASVSCLFKNRYFVVDAEDQNLLWFSKQVIESTTVEMSDLLTLYVAPTTGAQGSTGSITALGAMDDKLIVFKKDAIYYVTGTGPDNTGANNDFSDPIFVTASVGCANPNSIVLMPIGLMFQSDKGIWLLGRDLSTTYIGAPVETYNSNLVKSAVAVPGTNQIRFILDSAVVLMYDYYFSQWGTFSTLSAMSSTLFNGLHTYLNKFGQVYSETVGAYLDGSRPVTMSFTTSWINLAGLQGYQRFYFMYLLGTYYSPFKLNVQLAYDYNPNPIQSVIVTPDNASANWGGENLWGSGGNWGGAGNVLESRVFPDMQKCSSFQLIITEIPDQISALLYNTPVGQGLAISGLNLVVGAKKGYRTQKASRSFG